MDIVTVLGARPQFIKASVVSRALESAGGISERVVHTGQHFDANMSGIFFDELGMAPPAVDLGIHGGRHGEMTGRMLTEIERLLLTQRPDAILTYGDTNSTMAAALAAAKLNIPVAHVEAGLRSFNRHMPEEINRVMTDHLSTWLFAPTGGAVELLRSEGIDPGAIYQVGDVMYDVALHFAGKAEPRSAALRDRLSIANSPYVLVTIHRAENTDSVDRLTTIYNAVSEIAQSIRVVWPLHPRTRKALMDYGLPCSTERGMGLIEPQGYLDMVALESGASVIATDSGGVQKEAYFHGVPCVTLRTETEWVELVEMGWNRIVPPDSVESIQNAVLSAVGTTGSEGAPYGSGDAALQIVSILTAATA